MKTLAINTDAYFDGAKIHRDGPYMVEIADGVIGAVHTVPATPGPADDVVFVPFLMPGLVEAHCHLFLDGAELDTQVRKEYLGSSLEHMLEVGRRNVAANLAAGITLVRDAGDRHGVNGRLKATVEAAGEVPQIRSPGRAIRKAGRYGSFMAAEVTDAQSIVRTIHELAPAADDLKVLLTGIIDFEKGEMKGGVQFDLEETTLIVDTARELGLLTYAHCSGPEGLRIAVQAGINSIEHGFFMEADVLKSMRDQDIAWVPTFSPVYFQYDRPELAGWNDATVAALKLILDRHFEWVARADQMGVPVVAGSDAGSYGVPHGTALIDELFFLHRSGMPLERVLASATTVPRRLWGCESVAIAAGNRANLIAMGGSPEDDLENLRDVRLVIVNDKVVSTEGCLM